MGFGNKPSKENAKLPFFCRVLRVLKERKIGVILNMSIVVYIVTESRSLNSFGRSNDGEASNSATAETAPPDKRES